MWIGAALALFASASQLWLQHRGWASALRRNGSLHCGAFVGAAGYARHTSSASGKAQWLVAYLTGNVNMLESARKQQSNYFTIPGPWYDKQHCKHASLICSWFQSWGTHGLTKYVSMNFADLFSSSQVSPNIAPQAQTIGSGIAGRYVPEKYVVVPMGLTGFAQIALQFVK